MSDRPDLIYLYDGTFDGLMCCVFESYYTKTVPTEIVSKQAEQISFFSIQEIVTDLTKSQRVIKSIPQKIDSDTLSFIKKAFLSCNPHKEILILRFLYLGFRYGRKVMQMLADDTVNEITKIVSNVGREGHFFKEFLRFSEYNDTLIAQIEPKNIVLPLISNHYCDRFRNQKIMIYDKTHNMALIYQNRKAEIISVEDLQFPQPDENEKNYRDLWTSYYNTIGIEQRYNPKCRMTMMPKRYWKNLTEFSALYSDNNKQIRESGQN